MSAPGSEAWRVTWRQPADALARHLWGGRAPGFPAPVEISMVVRVYVAREDLQPPALGAGLMAALATWAEQFRGADDIELVRVERVE